MTVTRFLQPPQSIAGRDAAAVAFSFQRQVPSPASLANVAAYPPMARQFSTEGLAAYRFGASAIAVPGRALDAILAGLTPARQGTLEVTASSTYGSLPALAPANLFRARHPGSWIAGGRNAVLNLTWHGARTIRRLTIRSLPGFAAAPKTVKITSPDGVRYASVGLDGLTEIVPALTTTRMSISFPVLQYATAAQPVSGQAVQLPVGLSGLSIPALNGLRPATLAPRASFSLPCGSGPRVSIDGHSLRTRVSGRVGALITFQPVRVRLCGAASQLTLGAGTHRLVSSRPGAFSLTNLSLAAPSPATQAGAGDRQVRVLAWQPEYRRLRVSAGPRAYLELHQNANPGWVATLDGRQLHAVRLDGWQQGYVLPAGSKGVVTLTFRPVKFYHVWIILSAVGVLGLLAAALVRRRRSVREPMDRPLAADPSLAGPPRPPGEPGEPRSLPTGWPAADRQRSWSARPAPARAEPALRGQRARGQTVRGQTVRGQTVRGQTVRGQTVRGRGVLDGQPPPRRGRPGEAGKR